MSAWRTRQVAAWGVVAASLAMGAAAQADLPRAAEVRAGATVARVRTYGGTVADAVRAAGVAVGPHDVVHPAPQSALRDRATITVRRAVPIRIIADGGSHVRVTAARTVDDVLAEAGVPVGAADRVYPAPGTEVWAGATVRVVRIVTRIVAVEERMPFNRVTLGDATMPRGLQKVVQLGRPGARLHRVAVTTADGVVVRREPVEAVITRPPLDRIVHVGTRRTVASRGEFAGREMVYMEATAYAPWHGKGVDGTTAIGLEAGYGVVAVDPRVIPLRSLLYIEGYGRAIAGDTGGAIKGYRIDLGYNTPREAYQFGRKVVRVYILSTPAARPARPSVSSR
ncbi:MAG: ubiquitin-like domain-containing protein [Armatimonadota bacterium]|nr:ubiquitin-like domain-containing protein [Armatimonadota bacterium]